MFSNLKNFSFEIKRITWKTDNDGNRYSENENKCSGSGHIQQASKEFVERFAMSMQTGFTLWADLSLDIRVGDTLTSNKGIFTVRGLNRLDYGMNKHLEVAIEGGK